VLFLSWRQMKIERDLQRFRRRSPSVRMNSSTSTGRPIPQATLSIELTPELSDILGHIERVTGESLEEIVVKSIALYRLSVDAHKAGKRIGVLDHNLGFEREVVGFDEHIST
jgi:hypothetical protein